MIINIIYYRYIRLGFSKIFVIQDDENNLIHFSSKIVEVIRASDASKDRHAKKLINEQWSSIIKDKVRFKFKILLLNYYYIIQYLSLPVKLL